MACLFRVMDSSTRKSASSRDKVATAGRGAGAGADGAAGVDGGAGWDGFVMDEAFHYASGWSGIGIVAAAFEYSNLGPDPAMSKLRLAEANFSRCRPTHTRRVGGC